MKYLKLFEEFSERGKDEVFSFLNLQYDIEKAWKLINDNPQNFMDKDGNLSTINLEELSRHLNLVRINREYLKEITEEQLEEPGIFIVDKEKDFNFLIDGWHRAYLKLKRGDKEMKVYTITNVEDINNIKLR